WGSRPGVLCRPVGAGLFLLDLPRSHDLGYYMSPPWGYEPAEQIKPHAGLAVECAWNHLDADSIGIRTGSGSSLSSRLGGFEARVDPCRGELNMLAEVREMIARDVVGFQAPDRQVAPHPRGIARRALLADDQGHRSRVRLGIVAEDVADILA